MLSPSGKTINGFYANGAIISGVFFPAFAAIHAVRNSFSITQDIFNEVNIEKRISALNSLKISNNCSTSYCLC
jgi:hypothetical protein